MNTATSLLPGQCIATTKAGHPCRGFALQGKAFCFAHDPAIADKRKEACARGGRARHGRRLGTTSTGDALEIHSLEDVSRLIVAEISMVRSLEKSISRARAVGYLAAILVTVYTQSELEQRIAALETAQGVKQ